MCGPPSKFPERTAVAGLRATAAAACVYGLLMAFGGGCASTKSSDVGGRHFDFQNDTFAYPNDLVWEYYYDDTGKWVHRRREPEPDYTHHCFVVVRSARQFFQNARFDASLPKADAETYARLVRRVVSVDPSHVLAESEKVVVPGYANLRQFSAAQPEVLKRECGGAWHSYFQRGHWRMIFPFSRSHQEKTVESLVADVQRNCPPVVHIVRFPQLTINHAILLFDVKDLGDSVVFSAYDPNKPDAPKELIFDRREKQFEFAGNDYWPGGRVNVYEIYRSWDY